MPCYDGSNEHYHDEAIKKPLLDKIDRLTNLLCEACSKLKAEDLSPELKAWHEDHIYKDKTNVGYQLSEIIQRAGAKELRELQKFIDEYKEKNK